MHRMLLHAGVGVAAVRLAGMAAGFALTVTLARVLGPEGVGVYGYAVMLLALLAVPINNGWATVLLRTTARAERSRQGGNVKWGEVAGLLRWGVRLALGLTVLLALGPGLLIFGPFGLSAMDLSTLALLAGVLFFNLLSGLRLAVLRGLDHPVWGQLPEMALRPLLILGLFLLFTSLNTETPSILDTFAALFGASMLTAMIGGGILWRKAPATLRRAVPQRHLSMWTRSATLFASNAFLVLLNAQTDFLMLGLLSTPEELGYYRVAIQIALLSGFAYTALNMIAMQRFAALSVDDPLNELQRTSTFLARLAFLGSLPLPLVFWFWGETLLEVLFGPGFEAARAPLMWLMGVQVLSSSLGFARTLLAMNGHEGKLIPITLSALLLNFLLTLILIPLMGMTGASISAFCAMGVWNVLMWWNSIRLTSVDTSVLGLTLFKRTGDDHS